MSKADSILRDHLVKAGKISAEAFDKYRQDAAAGGQSVAYVLARNSVLAETESLDIIGRALGLSRVELHSLTVDRGVVEKVPSNIAHYYSIVPVKISEHGLVVAASYPPDIKIQDEIRTQLGMNVDVVLATSGEIQDGLRRYYGFGAETLGRMAAAPAAESQAQENNHERVEDIEKRAEDASVVQLVNQLILEAFRKRATDIHIEPYRDAVNMRYRIDGILYDANVPIDIKRFLNAIISRIKIMSNLNIVERRLPQDGRAVVKVGQQVLDLRISTIPTPFGESVVIRILPTKMLFNLDKLGLEKRDQALFEEFIQKPHGIIFVTGPTGSGKTTTLYACLSKINTKDRKIITIEDPIEYEMPGITQIQVAPEIGMDFARGLRSILRHDPDVIMVGEVRDLETAEIAIRVALTGHLVFSTVHTNDAASGVTRLVDIGLEPYLVASSVEAFIAQRLIRLNCPACRYEDTSVPEELKETIARELGLKGTGGVKVFRGKGCPNCNNTGFLGRTAIYEILIVDEIIKDLIIKKSPSNQIKRAAVNRGMRTLRQDGWMKVISGASTPEEVMKVTSGEAVTDRESAAYPPINVSLEAFQNELVPGGENQRVYDRLQNSVNIKVSPLNAPEELVKRGINLQELSVTRNISAGGLLFASREPVPMGSVLSVSIELPEEGGPIECLSRVVRIDEVEMGKRYDIAVCYLDLTGAQRLRLEKYVDRKAFGR